MKTRDLIPILQQHPDLEVVLARDSDGNGFSSLNLAEIAGHDAQSGEVGKLALTDEDRAHGFTEEDVRGTPAIVLWP